MPPPAKPGVLLDRDGTLIEERHYLRDPDQVALVAGAGAALERLNHRGVAVVLVTNQSGVARGFYDEAAVGAVHQRLAALLAAEGAHLDAVYYCPHHPEHSGPCECRKPAAGMARRAAADLGLDLARSFVVGDKLCDVDLARAVGATPLLVRTGHGAEDERAHPEALAGVEVVDDLPGALAWIQQRLDAAEGGAS